MNLIIVGYKGRLGSQIFDKARVNHNVIGIDKDGDIFNLEGTKIDAIIDVSCAENSLKTAKYAKEHKIPLIVGCTGHTKSQIEEILSIKDTTAVMICPNFSIGICCFVEAIKQILKGPVTDAYILEKHHKNKKDSPSGTAKMLENIILSSPATMHETISIRQNNIVGEHKVEFYFENEHIVLSHSAESRDCFASGAILALEQIANKPTGIYELKDFLY